MVNTLLIVRHSERIDESKILEEKTSWKVAVANDTSQRHKADLYNDPILTKRGIAIAAVAAKSLRFILNDCAIQTKLVGDDDSNIGSVARNISGFCSDLRIDRIYSSRLRRCIDTAYQLALNLDLPIYVSTGLALTALAVERRKGSFEFHSRKEIRAFCPGVRVVFCDNDVVEDDESNCLKSSGDILGGKFAPTEICCNENLTISTLISTSTSEKAEGTVKIDDYFMNSGLDATMTSTVSTSASSGTPMSSICDTCICTREKSPSERFVPSTDWLTALTAIAENHPHALIVAHRESIRNLTSAVNLPGYCHTAVFHHTLYDGTKCARKSYPVSDLSDSGAVELSNIKQSNFADLRYSKNSTDFIFKYLLDEKGTVVA